MTADEHRQRLGDIDSALRTLTRQRGVLDDVPDSPERSADIDRIESRIADLRAERAELTGTAPTVDILHAYVGRMNARLMEMDRERMAHWRHEATERHARQRTMNLWMVGMSVLLAIELAAIVWIIARVF